MTTIALHEMIPGFGPSADSSYDRLDHELLVRAYRFSEVAHAGQVRHSGEPYVSHCVEVARILADLQLDTITVASGLLHDIVEDTDITVQDVEREFGPEIAQIVDGLTKIANLPLSSREERQVENYRKLLLSIAKDARVILIKLADRLHNMRTLDWLAPDKRRRIAQETRDLYAPLAHRFGMAKVRWELEDLSFKHLEPDAYKSLARLVAAKRTEREQFIAQLRDPLEKRLSDAGIVGVEVTGRPKHLWSIYKKMQQRDRPYEDIYDLLAIRVIVPNVLECYHALGVIHDGWTPVQERIKDYIAQPKSNGYQSLHTTVFGPGRQLFEIQIRTRDMHRTADFGIAAHWLYKESTRNADELDKQLAWFRQVLELQLDAETPGEFLEFLKLDLYQDEIFVFTPTGDVIQLPKGATPLDFAFAVHTQVGAHCAGAKVNGRIAPLSRELKNSETVEVLTNPNAKPSRDWLAHVRTGRARHKIRQMLRLEERSSAMRLGREIIERELRRRRLPKIDDAGLQPIARLLKLKDTSHLIASIGAGDIHVLQVLKAIHPELETAEAVVKPTTFERIVDRVRGTGKGIRIQGADGLLVRYSQCCQPVPGDKVVGYVTRGRGVSIHRGDCPNLLLLAHEPERRLDIDWHEMAGERFVVRLAMEGTDRRGLYADVAAAVSATGTDIKSLELKTTDGKVTGAAMVEVENLAHLERIMKAARRVKGIAAVSRREKITSDV
ncbi:MAG: bifunctional (p)ppGpp synthetase/guanosine-3',5'-bis(diphosphate) 3'-pyrophosphohydrolase [Gemmatimonadota bacterium]|nr:bifunctional (p)ppGpp synthetase/guanosine-3',5'-bis(diphosphate) 3'-pyrophosphohydrolase [Gemmatimonadota bacterium]MDQ8166447.1 bifunctional (p)ppGpp synthetase/guanosine-3',5'-bis(diphosphate) 3'-pyrophosphohydrolase [Gemmatimonadota bacterium]MDQ8172302.1 bifunctional (p)ppGpp synthetase/guanosine-3',5'-bis(diphosphate) 3'-pyrophosphohydrolase [Gemmatimonadota bacterium]